MSKKVKELLAVVAAFAVVVGVGIAGEVINDDDEQGSGSATVIVTD